MAQGGVKFSAKSKGGSGSASKKGGIMKKGGMSVVEIRILELL